MSYVLCIARNCKDVSPWYSFKPSKLILKPRYPKWWSQCYQKVFFPIRNHQGCPGEVWSSKGCSNCRPHDIVFKRSPTCCSKLPDAAFWEEEPGSRGFFHRFCFRGHSSSFGASPNLFLSQLPILKPPRVYALCLVAGVVEVTFECLEHSQVGILRFGKDSEMFL